jgi:hypothetical protein
VGSPSASGTRARTSPRSSTRSPSGTSPPQMRRRATATRAHPAQGSLPLGHHRQGKRQGRRTPLGPLRARQAARQTHPARPSQSQTRSKGSLPLDHHSQDKRQGRRTPLGPHRARQAARQTRPARPSQSQARGKGSLPLGHHRQGKRQGRRTPLDPHRARRAARGRSRSAIAGKASGKGDAPRSALAGPGKRQGRRASHPSCAASAGDSPAITQAGALITARLAPSQSKLLSQPCSRREPRMKGRRAAVRVPARRPPQTARKRSSRRRRRRRRSSAPGPQHARRAKRQLHAHNCGHRGGDCNRGGSEGDKAASPTLRRGVGTAPPRGPPCQHFSPRPTVRSP